MQGMQVWSLVRDIRSHLPCSQRNQNMKQKKYCNKFNKDFKNDPHEKDLFKNCHLLNIYTANMNVPYRSPSLVIKPHGKTKGWEFQSRRSDYKVTRARFHSHPPSWGSDCFSGITPIQAWYLPKFTYSPWHKTKLQRDGFTTRSSGQVWIFERLLGASIPCTWNECELVRFENVNA